MLERPEWNQAVLQAWYESWDTVVSYVRGRQDQGSFREFDAYHVVHGFRRTVTQLFFELTDLGEDAARGEFDAAVGAMIDVMLTGLRA